MSEQASYKENGFLWTYRPWLLCPGFPQEAGKNKKLFLFVWCSLLIWNLKLLSLISCPHLFCCLNCSHHDSWTQNRLQWADSVQFLLDIGLNVFYQLCSVRSPKQNRKGTWMEGRAEILPISISVSRSEFLPGCWGRLQDAWCAFSSSADGDILRCSFS